MENPLKKYGKKMADQLNFNTFEGETNKNQRTMAEDKRSKFERLGQKRMVQTLNDMDKVKKLSNKINYEYTQKDVDKIKKTLEDKIQEVVSTFEDNLKKGGGSKPKNNFSFTGRSSQSAASQS